MLTALSTIGAPARLTDPAEIGSGPPTVVAAGLHKLLTDRNCQLLVARGDDVLDAVAADPELAGRCWAFLGAGPAPLRLSAEAAASLDRIATASRRVLCPDEDWRTALEYWVPAAAGRTIPIEPVDRLRARLGAALRRDFPTARLAAGSPASWTADPLRVGVAGHDLKFFTRLLDHLQALPGVQTRIDHWSGSDGHDEASSVELRDWADVVICEWCLGNAVWYSRNRRPGQRLIIRLHRFETGTSWPAKVDIDSVDRVVFVNPVLAEQTVDRLGWPLDRCSVVPNWVDVDQLDRPKLPDADYTLGMIGISPMRKRLDLTLDILERVRAADRRFTLSVKTQLPWEVTGSWRDPIQRAHYARIFRRIKTSQLLRDAVTLDPFGPDVGSWLRRVGYVLSTSDDEGSHVAPSEGMASGAIPMLLPWAGADQIYDRQWIHPDPAAMAETILAITNRGRWPELSRLAQQHARAGFALDLVCDRWSDLVAGASSSRGDRATT